MALLKPKSLGTSLLSNWILKEPSSSCRNPVTPRSVGTDPGPIWLRLSDDQAQLRLGAFLLLQLSVPAPRAWWLGMPQTVLMVKGAKSESRSCPLLSRGGKSNIGYPGREGHDKRREYIDFICNCIFCRHPSGSTARWPPVTNWFLNPSTSNQIYLGISLFALTVSTSGGHQNSTKKSSKNICFLVQNVFLPGGS